MPTKTFTKDNGHVKATVVGPYAELTKFDNDVVTKVTGDSTFDKLIHDFKMRGK